MLGEVLNIEIAKELCEILSEKQTTARESEKYFEVVAKEKLDQRDAERAERELRKKYHVKVLGVSGTAEGYRMWGVSFKTKEGLKKYHEQSTRNHKEIGWDMKLFHFHQHAAGEVFLSNNGVKFRNNIRKIIDEEIEGSYDRFEVIETPGQMNQVLWKSSGHLENFRESMMFIDEDHAIKPMNCPGHILHYKSLVRSYRDLPLRFFEYGRVCRNEASGALNGLLRMRSFVQDDGHIFCELEHIEKEIEIFLEQTRRVYKRCGFEKIKIYLSTRPENYAGEIERWDKAEEILRRFKFEELEGEGAFYGPKLEIHLEDSLGRSWQCGTVQLDFVLPERMDVNYTDRNGNQVRAVMIHRAIIGSFERFMSIILESNDGWLNDELTPVKVGIIPVNEKYANRCFALKKQVKGAAVLENQSLGKSVKIARTRRIPKLWIIGEKETDYVTEQDLRSGESKTKKDKEAIEDVCR